MPTTRKQTPAQARKSALESDFAPIYAVAGLTDAFAASVKATLAQTQDRAVQGVSALQSKPAAVEQRAKLSAEEISRFITSLPEQVKALPVLTKARITEVQQQAQSMFADATSTYGDLAGRGKRVVDGTIVTAKTVSTKAERRRDEVLADVADAVDPAFERVQETVTVARKTVTGRTATPTVTPRAAAKASTARKVAAERTEAQKMAAREAAAQRRAAAKAAAETEPAPKAPRKTAVKKAPAVRPGAPAVPAGKADASAS